MSAEPNGEPANADEQPKSIVKTTLHLLPFVIVFRAGEALLPWFLAFWFGRSHATDIYNFAWAVFLFAGSLIFSAYHDSAVVPILAEAKLRDPSSVRTITGSLLAYTWALGGALALAVAGLALVWFRLRYEGDDFHAAALMVPAFAVQLVALSTKTFFAAVLSAHHRFVPYPIASALGIAVTLAVIAVWRSSLGIVSVPLGAMLGEIAAAAMLGFVLLRHVGLVPKLTFERPEAVRRFARLVISEVSGNAVTRINPVVDQLMAGLAGVAGGATLLRYSGDVASLPTSAIQATLLSVLLTHLADHFAARDFVKLRRTVARASWIVFGVLAVAGALLALFREPILRLVFLHGQMDEAGVLRMAHILPYHLVGLAPFGVLLVMSRAHIAVQNSRIMFAMGIFNAGTNAIMNVVLVRFLGLEGIALSTSCVHTAVAIVFVWLFVRKARRVGAPAEAT